VNVNQLIERRSFGHTGLAVSCLALGGHEYLPDGRMKGWGDDPENAVKAGYERADFGGFERQAIVARAIARGVTFFDATQDPEVSALGRAMGEHPSSPDVLVQVRPQEMCYRYDPGNATMLAPGRLRSEVERLRDLLQRDRIDILNLGIEREALEGSPDYFSRLGDVLGELKSSGLIQFVACDSLFSGESQYLAMISSGCFDIAWLSFGPLQPAPADEVLPTAKVAGLAVVAREAFSKGTLFRVAANAGIQLDTGQLAAAAERWILNHTEVSVLAIGVRTVRELDENLDAVKTTLDDEDRELLDQVLATPEAGALLADHAREFRTP